MNVVLRLIAVVVTYLLVLAASSLWETWIPGFTRGEAAIVILLIAIAIEIVDIRSLVREYGDHLD